MSKNNLLALVGVVLIIAVMWFLKSANEMKRALTTATLTSIAAATSVAEPAVAKVEVTPNPSPDFNPNSEALAALQARLATEQQRLEEQRSLLANLQTQQAEQVPPAAYRLQMGRHQEQIRDLNQDLRDARQQENRVDETTSRSLRAQEQMSQKNLAQLDAGIRSVEGELQKTTSLISVWPNSMPAGVTPQARMEQLKATQSEQQTRLAQLRGQLSEVATARALQSQAVQQRSAQARDQLINSQEAIQNQIVFLRNEIQQLQSAQDQSRTNVMTLSSQVSQVQKNIDAQKQQVESMKQGMSAEKSTPARSNF